MTATPRVPCPKCGTPNFPQDPVCLGCGCRFTVRPTPSPPPRAVQYAPDEMCLRCTGVLLPAAQFDTSNTLGGIDAGMRSFGGGIGSPGMVARELSGVLWVLDFLANLLVGSIIAKNFQKRLQAALREYPNSLCCPSCRAIVKR